MTIGRLENIRKSFFAKSTKNIKYFKAFAILFFFFNSFLLPSGLLYTALISPWLYLWLLKEKVKIKKYILYFFLIFLFLFFIHYSNGINLNAYLTSSMLYFTTFIFCIVIYHYFNKYYFTYELLVEKIVSVNWLFIILAIFLLPLNENSFMWNFFDSENGRSDYPRLQLLTPEPSHYGFLLTPILLFYFQYYFHKNLIKRKKKFVLILLLSLVLCGSLGAIANITLVVFLFLIINLMSLRRSKRTWYFLVISLFFVWASFTFFFYINKDSNFFLRISDIISGNDSSVNDRSWQSFFLADQIVSLKSWYFGIGPGQLKIIGHVLIRETFGGTNDIARIPNALAETIVIFGYIGALARMFFEIYFFIKTKVIESSYRLCIFISMFLYQFAHGYTTNLSEYLLWILAFSNTFPDSYFKKKSSK